MAIVEGWTQLAGGLRLPYVEQGRNDEIPVVFTHAFLDSWRSFELVLEHLPSSIHAVAPTQRGHGDADHPATGYRTRDFAEDLAEFMDAVGLDAAVIAGSSSGGVVARRFAVMHPDRVLGLVLINSPFTLRDKTTLVEFLRSTVAELTDPVPPGLVRDVQGSTIVEPVSPAFFEALLTDSRKVPARVWKETIQGLLDDDASEDTGKITAPTLILWGDRDPAVPLEDQSALTAAIPNARLVVYPGAGHALCWEEPKRVADDVTAFVDALRPPRQVGTTR
ncbi:MAG: alpha/beta fold hydrolase [Actinomycetota bacterium]